ncbi:MAG: ABC-type Fe3+/spermidine/putrescine transport system ATPase subunit, partial [Kiritimatiellia bacterium]
KVLLLDEPLSNLDAKLREEMRDEIRALVKRAGVTVIIVTHDQEEALGLSDRVAVMDRGVLQQVDTPRALYQEPANALVARFVGTLNELPGVRAADRVVAHGVSVPAFAPSDIPTDGPCILGFRPEHAQFGPTGIPGRVRTRAFLGSTVRYRVDIGEDQIVVDGSPGHSPGDTVHVQVERGFALPMDHSPG